MDNFGRAEWDELWMTLAFLMAQKSLDNRTKHGCVAVNDENTLLSLGYNSPPRKCIEENMPKESPLKYGAYIHSEINCIINASRSGVSLKNSIFYITGHPCSLCFGSMINAGVKKIIYGPVNSHCLKEEGMNLINEMKIGQDIEMVKYEEKFGIATIQTVLRKTEIYLKEMCQRKMLEND